MTRRDLRLMTVIYLNGKNTVDSNFFHLKILLLVKDFVVICVIMDIAVLNIISLIVPLHLLQKPPASTRPTSPT